MLRLAGVLVTLLLAVPAAGTASSAPAVSSLAAQVRAVAARTGFSGEVAVAMGGRIVYAKGFGVADRSTARQPSLDTSFQLASMGKMFTAVAIAQLVQHGDVRFDDPVGRYLPSLPKALLPITIAQLLDHTSGLGDFFGDRGFERRRPTLTTLQAYLPLVEKERLLFSPGTRWSYSNSGYILAGLVIERVSGEPYDHYLRKHVWSPAGMTHAGCFTRTRLPPYAAVGYGQGGAPNTADLPPRGSSAGGCYASARDLISFAAALEDGKLLTPRLVRTITTSKARAPGGGYGYGFAIRYGRPGDPPTVWHNGGAPGAAGELDLNVGRKTTVVTLGNVSPPQVVPVVDTVLNALRIP